MTFTGEETLPMLSRYISRMALKTEEGEYPVSPPLFFLSGSAMPSTYEKSLCSKKSFEENDSSLAGLDFPSFPSLAFWPQRRLDRID